ncbi:hypothetical protein D3C86_1838350 [compost metagenome]
MFLLEVANQGTDPFCGVIKGIRQLTHLIIGPVFDMDLIVAVCQFATALREPQHRTNEASPDNQPRPTQEQYVYHQQQISCIQLDFLLAVHLLYQ